MTVEESPKRLETSHQARRRRLRRLLRRMLLHQALQHFFDASAAAQKGIAVEVRLAHQVIAAHRGARGAASRIVNRAHGASSPRE